MKKTKTQEGITLIALIITIVVLLILAVVTINAIQGDGIIRYASNAADDYTAKANEEQENLNTLLGQIEGSLSEEEKITWTKTSEGDLSIGSTVQAGTEVFYVIGGDEVGAEITTSTEKVILLAKNNLNEDGSAQGTGAVNPCAFSTVENLSFTDGEDLNNNSTVKADTTSAVSKAMKYGETLGVTTGRLMLISEVEDLYDIYNNRYSDIVFGDSGKSSGEYLSYWLGSAFDTWQVHVASGYDGAFTISAWDGTALDEDDNLYFDGFYYGVRPVVEILKSNIS